MTLFLPALFLLTPAAPPEAKVDFNRDVRPILADHCFQCHGPDAGKRKAKLRLDTDPTAEKRHAALIVHGRPEQSELVRRVASLDPSEKMPPAGFARPLSPKQVETLMAWVKQGGRWERHWALVPPVRPEPPATRHPVANPIDAFVFARLEKEGLAPSPPADRTTLVRRMSFDLTGLPPTPAEVDAFVNDAHPDAVGRLADRLLASPRYGERMAWRWLEAARYADTNGYQTDAERHMWRWRDWVIDAYNRNLPFDRFTVEQLAGDMLPGATLDQRIATGFNRNHRGNSEGGIVPEEYAVEYVVDRVETTGTVWLGLTVGCARCHDHKFDALTQREFYQLFAFFNNVPEKGRAVKFGNSPPFIVAPTPEQQAKLDALSAKVRAANDAWDRATRRDDFGKWTPAEGTAPSDWLPERGLVFASDKSFTLDGSAAVVASKAGDFGYDDRFALAARARSKAQDGVILSRMKDEPETDGYAVVLMKGKLQVHLTKRWLDDALRVETEEAFPADREAHVLVTYDGSRAAAGVKVYVDGQPRRLRVLLDELNQNFQTPEPLRIGAAAPGRRFVGEVRDVRVYSRLPEPHEVAALSAARTLAAIAAAPEGQRSPVEKGKLLAYYLEHAGPREVREAFAARRTAAEEREAFERSLPTVMVMEEMPTPRPAHLLLRGEYDKKGEAVSPGLPAALGGPATHAVRTRLDLARWLVSPTNPLTARVAVNRMWQLHFGTGLVRTVEDFGTQGESPSHPELFDWLATEFARDWDVKRMHRLIVTSAAYRQSSRVAPQLLERDPANRLLARGPRLRLSAEMIRDQALFASGLLAEKRGGPSVKPYQPKGLWSELSGAADYAPDTGEGLYRRSLYTYWKRSVPPPTLGVFDTATRETCWVRETRTNTPLHALTLLNDVTFVEAGRVLAERAMREEAAPDARIALAFRRLTARVPAAAEVQVLRAALDRQLAAYRANPAAAARLLRVGESKPNASLDPAELAAYATVCCLILNLDEAVTKE